MRRTWSTFTAVGFFLACVVPSFAATETVRGKLIDLACYSLDKANTGLSHNGKGTGSNWKGFDCARACAKEGFDVGVLTPDGKIYKVRGALAANNNVKLWPHMAETVTITGEVTKMSGQSIITASDLK